MSKMYAALTLGFGVLAAAPAAAQKPPVERYTLNVSVEAVGGAPVYRKSKECDPARWCEVEGAQFIIAGKERYFTVETRVFDGSLRFRYFFPVVAAPQSTKRQVLGDMPFREKETEVIGLFDSDDGRELAVLKTPKIAQLRLDIRY